MKEEGGGGGKGEGGRRKRKYTKLRKIENTLYRLKGRYPLTSKQRNKQTHIKRKKNNKKQDYTETHRGQRAELDRRAEWNLKGKKKKKIQ